MQKESFGYIPKYNPFMRDLQQVSRDVIVNAPGWQQKLADSQRQFADKWPNLTEFKALYDGLSNEAYVNALYANAGIVPAPAEPDRLVNDVDTAVDMRVSVLLAAAANSALRQLEQNP